MTVIERLNELGQSVWLDYISRDIIDSGKLKEWVGKGLRGVTSNPTIFDNAIRSSSSYDSKIAELSGKGKSAFEIYDELTVKDIQDATDVLKGVYEKSGGLDGYVSLEVKPTLSRDTAGTIEETKRLHGKVNRQNVMFKIPATDEAYPAIEELVSSGININVTLIFSPRQYEQTAMAYIRGIKKLAGKPALSKVRSVASVFVSRIDTKADKLLDELAARDSARKNEYESLMGKAAVANSGIIYGMYRKLFSSDEFNKLKAAGANVQRVLWGSTGTKNPSYSDIKYIEELIAGDTVNTVPEKTLLAFLDHGKPELSMKDADAGSALKVLGELKKTGVNIDAVNDELITEGLDAFEKSFSALLKNIESKAGKN